MPSFIWTVPVYRLRECLQVSFGTSVYSVNKCLHQSLRFVRTISFSYTVCTFAFRRWTFSPPSFYKGLLLEGYIIPDSDHVDLADAAAGRMSRVHFEDLATWSLKRVAFGNSYLVQQSLHTAGPLPLLSTSKFTHIFKRDLTMAAESSNRSKLTPLPSSENSFARGRKLKRSTGRLDRILLDLQIG